MMTVSTVWIETVLRMGVGGPEVNGAQAARMRARPMVSAKASRVIAFSPNQNKTVRIRRWEGGKSFRGGRGCREWRGVRWKLKRISRRSAIPIRRGGRGLRSSCFAGIVANGALEHSRIQAVQQPEAGK